MSRQFKIPVATIEELEQGMQQRNAEEWDQFIAQYRQLIKDTQGYRDETGRIKGDLHGDGQGGRLKSRSDTGVI